MPAASLGFWLFPSVSLEAGLFQRSPAQAKWLHVAVVSYNCSEITLEEKPSWANKGDVICHIVQYLWYVFTAETALSPFLCLTLS